MISLSRKRVDPPPILHLVKPTPTEYSKNAKRAASNAINFRDPKNNSLEYSENAQMKMNTQIEIQIEMEMVVETETETETQMQINQG